MFYSFERTKYSEILRNENKYLFSYLDTLTFTVLPYGVFIREKLKTHFLLQIFLFLYEIIYNVQGSNILQKVNLM